MRQKTKSKKKRPYLKQSVGLICTCLFLFLSCQQAGEPSMVQVSDGIEISNFQLLSLTGRRDGDRLPIQIVFKAGSSNLHMDLNFRIGIPTDLESGHYQWQHPDQDLKGQVRARSVTFLGGQSDFPNLGGVFELLSGSGSPLYKVTVPTSQVGPPSSGTPFMQSSH